MFLTSNSSAKNVPIDLTHIFALTSFSTRRKGIATCNCFSSRFTLVNKVPGQESKYELFWIMCFPLVCSYFMHLSMQVQVERELEE